MNDETPTHTGGISKEARERQDARMRRDREKGLYTSSKSRSGDSKTRDNPPVEIDGLPLYQQLFVSNDPQQSSLSWLHTYNVNPSQGFRILMDVILHFSGINVSLPTIDAEDIETLTVDKLNSWIDQTDFEPHIISKKFYKRRLSDFIARIGKTLLTDAQVMKKLQHLLVTMHNSNYKSARLSALMIQMALFDKYILILSELESAGRKPSNKNYIVENINLVFNSLRDEHFIIRKIALEHVFYLATTYYPNQFSGHLYLQEIYWKMFDESPTMRISAMQKCCLMITSWGSIRPSQILIEKCTNVFILLTRDANTQVSIEAIKALSEHDSKLHMIIPDNRYKVFKLIFCDRPAVASETAKYISRVLAKRSSRIAALFIGDAVRFLYKSQDPTPKTEDQLEEDERVMMQLGTDAQGMELRTRMMSASLLSDMESFKDELKCRCDRLFVEMIFPHAHVYLTDWKAWITILTDEESIYYLRPSLAVTACQLLSTVVQYAATASTITKMCPPIDDYFRLQTETNTDERDSPEENQEITNALAVPIIHLLQKFIGDIKCLCSLFTIPRHFCCNGQIDFKKIIWCLVILIHLHNSPEIFEEGWNTIACLHKIMLGSETWKEEVSNMDGCLFVNLVTEFGNLVTDFEQACTAIVEVPYRREYLIVIKKCFYLLKYFNCLSQTPIRDAAFSVLKYRDPNKISQIMPYFTSMCFYIIEWDLKNALNSTLSAGRPDINILEENVNNLANVLRQFLSATHSDISATHSDIRSMAFTLTCRLWQLFAPNSKYNKGLQKRIEIRPDLLSVEWLDFNFVLLVPYGGEKHYKDKWYLQVAKKHLNSFCSLITSGIIDMTYFSTLLPYFKLRSQDMESKLFSSILAEIVHDLSLREKFPSVVVESLVKYRNLGGKDYAEELAACLCNVGFTQLKDVNRREAVCLQIVYNAITYIYTYEKHLSHLPMFSCFTKLISNEHASEVKAKAENVFAQNLDNIWVKEFLDSIL